MRGSILRRLLIAPRRVATESAGNFLRNDQGAAMVEFALVTFVFVSIILLGILEFGFATWSKNSVAADAREGARFAIVHGAASPAPATQTDVRAYILTKTSLDSIRVSATWSPNNSPGSVVTVQVQHDRPRRGLFLRATTDVGTSKMVVLF
jgi:Flp pilus assembly protein TadG